MCKIDNEMFTISFNVSNKEIVLPVNTKRQNNSRINTSARTETTIPVNIDIDQDSILVNTEIKQGVFSGNTIIPKKCVKHIEILNITNKDITIKENYYICKRNQQIELKQVGIPKAGASDIMVLC